MIKRVMTIGLLLAGMAGGRQAESGGAFHLQHLAALAENRTARRVRTSGTGQAAHCSENHSGKQLKKGSGKECAAGRKHRRKGEL